jgi:hypothetical protein
VKTHNTHASGKDGIEDGNPGTKEKTKSIPDPLNE